MGIKHFSLSRPITSYIKVQAFIGLIKRGRPLFINKKSIRTKNLLNIGCGANINRNFVNLDYWWIPNIEVCWDIEKKAYPFEDNRFEGIYTEHCLEHISFDAFLKNIKEFYRILKPGGSLRLIVPDGELYFDIYQKQKLGENCLLPYQEGYISPMARINALFRGYGHKFIYDYFTIEKVLKENQFKKVQKTSYLQGQDNRLLIDSEARRIESLYIEAIK